MTVHAAHHPADTAPVLCGRWVGGNGSCDRPVGHEGRCEDSMAPPLDPDRCAACGLRPTWENERLCEACGSMVEKGGCEFCGARHAPRITCGEVQNRIDRIDTAHPEGRGFGGWAPANGPRLHDPLDVLRDNDRAAS